MIRRKISAFVISRVWELAANLPINTSKKRSRYPTWTVSHGIVLAKNQIAKACGIKTGNVLWEARHKCPGLISVPTNFELYLKFSKKVREIYADYTDLIEPFGIDENWLDVTGNLWLYGSGEKIADEIRKRVYEELGVTVSVGVSFNKIFAKLGSDMKKPDATTIITKGADYTGRCKSGLLHAGRISRCQT